MGRFLLRKNSIGTAIKAEEKHEKRIFFMKKQLKIGPGMLRFRQIPI
jgi:hypothetical protein